MLSLLSSSQAQEETSEAAAEVTAGDETVESRLQPFGKVCMQGEDCGEAQVAAVSSGGRTGIEVYNKHCFACHATGVSEDPLVASEAWLPRLEKGDEVLMTNTRNGFNVTMPPMGTCMDCSDAELKAAIDYMVTGEE